jgi:uncharacterized OsmC-like protein
MTGTFGGALEARGVPAGEGYLSSDTVGEIEKDGNVLVIRRIHIVYHLKIDAALLAEKRDAVERAYRAHPPSCPVHRSISGCIDITTDLVIEQT